MVHPFLDSSLHLHLHQPVDIVRSRFVIRRFGNQFVNLFLSVTSGRVVSVSFHPSHELVVEYDIFFECVACLVNKVNMYVRIIRIYFSSTLVNRQENRFNTGSRLCHQTGCSCRSNRQTGNITTTVFLHFCIQFRISFGQTLNERVVLFAFVAVYFESTTFFSHFNRRTIGTESNCFVYFL